MATKRETKEGRAFLNSLQENGWFRNITDKFQVGVPDYLGCYKGILTAFELKAIRELPRNGLAPTKSDHTFTPVQVRELRNINTFGGIGLGIILCGRTAFFFTPDNIRPDGRVDCKQLLKERKFITKEFGGAWKIEGLLEAMWRARLGDLIKRNPLAPKPEEPPKVEEVKGEQAQPELEAPQPEQETPVVESPSVEAPQPETPDQPVQSEEPTNAS